MFIHKKAEQPMPTEKPVDIKLTLHGRSEVSAILHEMGKHTTTAVMRFTVDNPDPNIIRALQDACARNGIEMEAKPVQLAQLSAPDAARFEDVALPGMGSLKLAVN